MSQDPLAAIVKLVDNPNLKEQIFRALPKHLDIERFQRICLTVIRTRRDIQRCEPLSIISSIVEASQLGLELDPMLGHGYLVPFHSKKRQVHVCTFMPGYRGFVHLMRNSGLITDVNAELVFRSEAFRVELGTERRIVHNPDYEAEGRLPKFTKEKGRHYDETNWRGAYATVRFVDGHTDFEFLPAGEINDARKRSASPNDGPWVSDTPAMWKKTPIRRISKRMPLSPQLRVVTNGGYEIDPLSAMTTRDERREDENYREREPADVALKSPQEVIDVEPGEDDEPNTAAPDEKPEKERIRRKSDDAKAAAEPAKSDEPAKQESAAKPTETSKPAQDEPRVSEGQVKSLLNFAVIERGMNEPDVKTVLQRFGVETPDALPKRLYGEAWAAIGNWQKPAGAAASS